MWLFFLLGLTGLIGLIVQGAISTIVLPPWSPDLGLLVVVGIALRWFNFVPGVLLAALLGLAADILSGSLMGQHLLLRTMVFIAVFSASRQLNLKGSLSLAIFVAGASLLYGIVVNLFTVLFLNSEATGFHWLGASFLHALINGLFAPGVLALISRVAIWAGADDSEERALTIESTGRVT